MITITHYYPILISIITLTHGDRSYDNTAADLEQSRCDTSLKDVTAGGSIDTDENSSSRATESNLRIVTA